LFVVGQKSNKFSWPLAEVWVERFGLVENLWLTLCCAAVPSSSSDPLGHLIGAEISHHWARGSPVAFEGTPDPGPRIADLWPPQLGLFNPRSDKCLLVIDSDLQGDWSPHADLTEITDKRCVTGQSSTLVCFSINKGVFIVDWWRLVLLRTLFWVISSDQTDLPTSIGLTNTLR
jgi:hypothetical protein